MEKSRLTVARATVGSLATFDDRPTFFWIEKTQTENEESANAYRFGIVAAKIAAVAALLVVLLRALFGCKTGDDAQRM